MDQPSLTLGLDRANETPTGLTHVIDVGTPLEYIRDFLEMAGEYVHIWKFGFGTGYLDPTVDKKVRLLSEWNIDACLGGTLMEAAWVQGKTAELFDWAEDRSFPMIELSSGVAPITPTQKRELITRASERFKVIAEVGSKDPTIPVSPGAWAQQMSADLEAGASYGVAEGRASGTVGLYTTEGTLRWEVAEELVDVIGLSRLVFEAPQTSQQAALIRRFGPGVGLGNIKPADVLALETLRRGLRGDTFDLLDKREP